MEFSWGIEQQKSYMELKELISSASCLALYDVNKDVTLEVDACNTGLGAVLIQGGKPVAFASRSLTSSQINYAIIRERVTSCGICL